MKYPIILNTAQACRLLGCGRNYLYRLVDEEKIPARWVGKGWRYHRDVLLRYVAEGQKRA